jgi:hypothetical protein
MKGLLHFFGFVSIALGLAAALYVLSLGFNALSVALIVAYVLTGAGTAVLFFGVAETLDRLERLETRR